MTNEKVKHDCYKKGNLNKPKELTTQGELDIDELNKKIIETSKIIKKYDESDYKSYIPGFNDKLGAKFYIDENNEFCEEKNNRYVSEEWRQYSGEPNIYVSNLGRVGYSQSQNKIDKIFIQEDIKHLAGYLYIKEYRQLRKSKKIKLYDSDYVYQMVAKTWLVPHVEDKNEIWDVHHISNDGYDNRPENLIWMQRHLHNLINHKTNK